jgi:hypothetical protein
LAASALGGRLVRAEGEEQDPKLNGAAYARWQLLPGARRQTLAGKSGYVVACRYVGSFASRESARNLKLRILRQDYFVPDATARELGVTRAAQVLPAASLATLKPLCPAPPEFQDAHWTPDFAAGAALAKAGSPVRALSGGYAPEETLSLELSARALSDAHDACDDGARHLATLFGEGATSEAHRAFCRALADREFERGMKRCLGVVNSALNRLYDPKFVRTGGEAVQWGRDDPTPSYCASLLPLAGPRFDVSVSHLYTCMTPFQTIRQSDFSLDDRALGHAIGEVYGSTSVRISPLLASVNRRCSALTGH